MPCCITNGLQASQLSCLVSKGHKSRDSLAEPCGLRVSHEVVLTQRLTRNGPFISKVVQPWLLVGGLSSFPQRPLLSAWRDPPFLWNRDGYPSVLMRLQRVNIWSTRHGGTHPYSKHWETKEDCSEASLGYRVTLRLTLAF